MFIALGNSSGDPELVTAITDCMLPQWDQLAAALEPIALPGRGKGLTVHFNEGLPRSHFEQDRCGMFHTTITGIDKQHFLTKATATERRDYLFNFVAESLERVDWPAETRQKAAEIFRSWRAALQPHRRTVHIAHLTHEPCAQSSRTLRGRKHGDLSHDASVVVCVNVRLLLSLSPAP